MLVLSRKLQEQIRIGDDVTITILRVKGNTVRIGIEAPRTKRVIRAELPALVSDETKTSEGAPSFEVRLNEERAPESSPESRSDSASSGSFLRQERLTVIKDRLRGHWPAPAAN